MVNDNSQQKQYIQNLWATNCLNIRDSVNYAKTKNCRIYALVTLEKTIIHGETNIIYPYAEQALREMSSSSYMRLILWTRYDAQYIKWFQENMFGPKNIFFPMINDNTEVMQPGVMVPHYDISIDNRAGFDPQNGWYWLWMLIKIGKTMLGEQIQEQEVGESSRILKTGTERFAIAPSEPGSTTRIRRAAIPLPSKIFKVD